MCTPVSSNGLNYSTYNNNNQETLSNYTKNTENLLQQKKLNDYTINTKKGHKLKKIASFILNAIKYFFCVVFFPITIIVLIIRKLTSLKAQNIQNIDYQKADKSINENSMEDAYNKMFNSDKLRKIKEIQNKNMTVIEKRDFLSKLFIKDIEDELGEITEKEQQIIKTMKALPDFKLQHQSEQKLVNNKILKIYARNRIKLVDAPINIGFSDVDDKVGSNDFVSFSVDFSGSSIQTPPTIVTHGTVFYGENSYVIPENIIAGNGYFSLIDQSSAAINLQSNILYKHGMVQFAELFKKVAHIILSSKYEVTPIFSREDIRLGMALYIIKSIRQVDKAIDKAGEAERNTLINQRAKFMTYLLKREENQNQLLNAILNLEYHAPVVVEAKLGEYAEHKVSKASAHRK